VSALFDGYWSTREFSGLRSPLSWEQKQEAAAKNGGAR
jgi:hypothetical protein